MDDRGRIGEHGAPTSATPEPTSISWLRCAMRRSATSSLRRRRSRRSFYGRHLHEHCPVPRHRRREAVSKVAEILLTPHVAHTLLAFDTELLPLHGDGHV